jgi:hypothetical protein
MELDGASGDANLVTQMLSQISSAHIEEVGLEIDPDDDEIGQVGWKEIDAALQHPSFSALRTVNVRIVHWAGWDPDAGSWVMDCMPRCHACGILRVCEKEWPSSFYFLP